MSRPKALTGGPPPVYPNRDKRAKLPSEKTFSGLGVTRIGWKMSYPTAYRRSGSPRSPQRAGRNFWRDESGFLRFPDGRGTWGNPTRPPGDPIEPARPMTRPREPYSPLTPPDPATRPQQDIPWWERGTGRIAGRALRVAGLALAAWEVADNLWPSDSWRWPYLPPPAGWNVLCGPVGYPGLPYRQQIRNFFSNTVLVTPQCSLGGQIFSTTYPNPLTHGIYYVWGPNTALLPAQRWYVDMMLSLPAGPQPAPLKVFTHHGLSVLPQAVAHYGPGVDLNVIPIQQPFPSIPRQQVADSPYATTRASAIASAAPSPKPNPGGLSFKDYNQDTRPKPRERERKLAPNAGAAFKFFSQVGSWHAVVNALWRSLPPRYSHRRRSLAGKLEDLYLHYDELSFDRALRNLFTYWLMYKAAGLTYGRVQKYLTDALGPYRGNQVYRGLVQSGNL